MKDNLDKVKPLVLPIIALILIVASNSLLANLEEYGGAIDAVRESGSPTPITEEEPVAREKQDIARQLSLTTAAAQNWSTSNYGVAGDVYCNQHTDNYASTGWSVCNVFINDKLSNLRCEFDLEEVPTQVKACEEL